MLRIQMERQGVGPAYFPSLREYTMLFGLDRKRYESLGKEVVLMHPGPINRGVEISSDMADSGGQHYSATSGKWRGRAHGGAVSSGGWNGPDWNFLKQWFRLSGVCPSDYL
jgi:hypothetical protein